MFQLIAVFCILAVTFLFFVKEWLPTDLVAMAAFALCIALNMLDGSDIAGVMSSSAPLTIGAMFILSAALTRTGVIDQLAHFFQKVAKGSEIRALVMMVVIVLPLSACVNNTPVVVVFLPVVIGFARSANLKASRLLIPLSFFSIMGGTMTLLGTSTNILVSGVATQHGLAPFSLLEITPLGAIFSVVGVIYMMLVGRKLLPNRDTVASLFSSDDTRAFISSAVVMKKSSIVGKKLEDTALWNNRSFRIFYVVRSGQRIADVALDQIVMQAGDTIVLKGSARGVGELRESKDFQFLNQMEEERAPAAKLIEVMVGPSSDFIGKTLVKLRLRDRYGVIVAALHRKGANVFDKLQNVTLQVGDTLIIEAPEANLVRFEQQQEHLVFLNTEVSRPYRRSRSWIAILAIVGVVLAAVLGVPILSASLVGAVLVMLTGCIDTGEAYRSVEWPILFIIFGMLGLGKAMENTGAAALVAQSVAQMLQPYGPWALLAVTYLLAALMTEMVTNNAVAILLAPIVIGIAHSMGVDPRPFVVAVMFGASASFSTPIGYQTNTYVFGAGGYKFSDFPKVGVPLSILLWIVAVVFIPLIWPFYS